MAGVMAVTTGPMNVRSEDRRSRKGSVAEMEIDWVSTLECFDESQLPTLEEAVAFERQVVNTVQDKTIASIEIGQSAIAANVVAVLQSQALHIS